MLAPLQLLLSVKKGLLGAEATPTFTSQTPPSPEEAAALAKGLHLAGRPLQVPRFIDMGWQEGQQFQEADDPDRVQTEGLWHGPEFLQSRSPSAQRARTSSTDLRLPRTQRSAGSFARVVRGVLDEEHCAELISRVNLKGFTPALINIGGGYQMLCPRARDGHRVIVDCPELTSWLFEVLRPHLPEVLLDGSKLVDLNERCRILCYTPGQEFPRHFDGCYARPPSHARRGDESRVTIQLYLHDVPSDAGGATTFLCGSSIPCQPSAGSVLLFTQDLEHEGSLLRKGLKYTLRTEAMYRDPRRHRV